MADEALRQADMKKAKNIAKPIKQIPTEVKKDVKKAEVKSTERTEQKIEDKKVESGQEVKKEEPKKEENKVEVKEEKRVKKDHASVYGKSLPISLKHSVAVGKFIKNKKIENAIRDLEQVEKKKLAVPFTGELAHKKGKGMGTGKYPVKASNYFIKLLKSLNANSSLNGMDIDKAIVKDVIPNKAPEQLHRFGSKKFKRTHVEIISKEGK